ncbi:methyltransferase domain-containing protein [Ulvibacter antarcticus]|uniref:Methyltransferase domain-containing protein n=1 Tax=Ulvibacter antarcticus TaxID=442714 RepID=A0A3L9YYW9_9FLAO|nr:methyltransferase domain-containing protein [Ulvibacter antarcticus]RMA64269.1 hypothetical protein BXY75_1142 [Ulvibacter antarcticus]
MEVQSKAVKFSSAHRSRASEIMDDFDLKGDEMKELLTDLKLVNKWLGGTKVTIEGLQFLLKQQPKQSTITILDVGCGDGEMLRNCARFGRKKGYDFKLIGIDANNHILTEAKVRSEAFENISFQTLDVMEIDKSTIEYDIVLCTLFLHHFPKEQIVVILNKLLKNAKVGCVINDLHRSRLAFVLFKLFSKVVLKTKIARHDGLVSVARGFKRNELKEISEEITNTVSLVKWKFAFRYMWILKK